MLQGDFYGVAFFDLLTGWWGLVYYDGSGGSCGGRSWRCCRFCYSRDGILFFGAYDVEAGVGGS